MNTTTQRRAKQGGENGANGSFYAGGRFLNTVAQNEKGSGGARVTSCARKPLTDDQRARTVAAITATEAQIARGEGDAEMLASYVRGLRRQMEVA